jgi:SAM-dependent methyltransferase
MAWGLRQGRDVSGPTDTWAAGDAYEHYVGRWSRPVAIAFIEWLAVPPARAWLDVGCGTGALSETIARHASPAHLNALDASPPYIAHARQHLSGTNAHVLLGLAQQMPLRSQVFDAVVSALALNFVPVPEAAVSEMARVARVGGIVAAYVWDYARGMQLIRCFWDAAVALDPVAAALDEGARFSVCQPDRLEALFRTCGLDDVDSRAIDVPTRFVDFDDYWSPFLGAQGPAPGYAMSLNEERRARLRDKIRRALPTAADGSIALTARAWAVRGRRSR